MSPIAVLGVTFVVLLLMNVPIAFAIGVSTLVTILSIGDLPTLTIIAQRMATGIGQLCPAGNSVFYTVRVAYGQGVELHEG